MQKKTFGVKERGKPYVARRGAYAVILEESGDAVLVKAPAAHGPTLGLFLVGGGIEPGETPEVCLQRECLEETGYTIHVGQPLLLGDEYLYAPASGDFLHVVGQCYLCTLGEKLTEPIEKDHRICRLPWEQAESAMFLRYQGRAVTLGGQKLLQQENEPVKSNEIN